MTPRQLIGHWVRHRGERCKVVEALESPASLVLETGAPAELCADLHGRPWEYGRAHRVVAWPLRDGDELERLD